MLQLEHEEQKALFQWARMSTHKYPELDLMYAIPNGGHRHIATARKMKAEGAKSGVPDIHLPVARGTHHGLYVEMKVGKGRVSDNQAKWIDKLGKQGYACEVCWSWEDAAKAIITYLEQ